MSLEFCPRCGKKCFERGVCTTKWRCANCCYFLLDYDFQELKQNNELKTLKDIEVRDGLHYRKPWEVLEELKQEAIKHLKKIYHYDDRECEWVKTGNFDAMKFFNIKGEDLK